MAEIWCGRRSRPRETLIKNILRLRHRAQHTAPPPLCTWMVRSCGNHLWPRKCQGAMLLESFRARHGIRATTSNAYCFLGLVSHSITSFRLISEP